VPASSISNAELGHGVMQWWSPSGLQRAGVGRLMSLLHAASAPAATATAAAAVEVAARWREGHIRGEHNRPGGPPAQEFEPGRECGARPAKRRTPRYNSAVRHALTFVVAAVVTIGCGTPPDPKRPAGAGSADTGSAGTTAKGGTAKGGTAKGGTAKGGTGGGSAAGGQPDPTPKDVACLVPTCVYHAGTNAYFSCLASGAGTCFHFGPACTPNAACMYDASSRGYKLCAKASEGACAAWGAACAPTSKCMFNPTDSLHHTCEDVSGGTCKRYGALCAP
jgi:hypothetical protein